MAHAALEGLEVAAAVTELADAAMGAYKRKIETSEELAREKEENDRLRLELEVYKDVFHEFKSKGLLQHMHQLKELDADELCDKLRKKVDSPEFLGKLGSIVVGADEHHENSWVVLEDLDGEIDTGEYVVITQEDIVDSIASYMAKYLITQPKAKNMSPEELQTALSKAFSGKEKPGFFRRIWGMSKVMYTIASWTATLVGIYRNPVLIRASFMALQTTVALLLRLLR